MSRGYKDEDIFTDDDLFDRSMNRRRGRGYDSDDDGVDIPDVEVIRETGQAILVRGKGLSSDPFGMNDNMEEGWFPLSQMHKRSEVRHEGDKGLLVITTWMAEKRGLR